MPDPPEILLITPQWIRTFAGSLTNPFLSDMVLCWLFLGPRLTHGRFLSSKCISGSTQANKTFFLTSCLSYFLGISRIYREVQILPYGHLIVS